MTSARQLAKAIAAAKDEIADARQANDGDWLRRAERRLADLLDERARAQRPK